MHVLGCTLGSMTGQVDDHDLRLCSISVDNDGVDDEPLGLYGSGPSTRYSSTLTSPHLNPQGDAGYTTDSVVLSSDMHVDSMHRRYGIGCCREPHDARVDGL